MGRLVVIALSRSLRANDEAQFTLVERNGAVVDRSLRHAANRSGEALFKPGLLLRAGVALVLFLGFRGLNPFAMGWLGMLCGKKLACLGLIGFTFYGGWFALLVLGTLILPRHFEVPWKLESRASPWLWALVLGGSAWPYRGSLLKIFGEGMTWPPLGILNGAVVAPGIEEWLFRGVLWQHTGGNEPRGGVALALVSTSVAFGVWHIPFSSTPLWIHGLFGLLMALLRWRTGSVWPGITVHAAGNALWFIAGGYRADQLS